MICVIKNHKTGLYMSYLWDFNAHTFAWTSKPEEAQRYKCKEVLPTEHHIRFVEIDKPTGESEVVNIDDAIAAYIKLRDKKAQIKAEADKQMAEVTVKLDKLENWMKEQADAQGVTSFKTKHGTAFLTTVDFATVADWDVMLNFVKQNDAYDMFEKRVSKTAVRGYIDQMKAVPPGVNYGTRIEVNVRKPTAKEE